MNGRFGWLHYTMNDPPVFGRAGGGPVASAGGRAGTGGRERLQHHYSASYMLRPNFIVDSYFGYTKSTTNHNPVRPDQKIGLKTLGLPGTNVTPEAGGWPDFQVSSYTDVGTPGGSSDAALQRHAIRVHGECELGEVGAQRPVRGRYFAGTR